MSDVLCFLQKLNERRLQILMPKLFNTNEHWFNLTLEELAKELEEAYPIQNLDLWEHISYNFYSSETLKEANSHRAKQLANILWGLDINGQLYWLNYGEEFKTEFDIEAMLNENKTYV